MREIGLNDLAQYLRFQYVPQDPGVRLLELERGPDSLRPTLDWIIDSSLSHDVAILLSGGVDSSLIAAIAREGCLGSVDTVCLGFDDPIEDESKYAVQVADYLGTDHKTIRMTGKDARAIVEEAIAAFPEPFADCSALCTWFLCKQVKELGYEGVIVGDGGDELFGGYPKYAKIERLVKIRRLLQPLKRIDKIKRLIRNDEVSFLRWAYGCVMYHFHPEEIRELIGVTPQETLFDGLLNSYEPVYRRLMLTDQETYLLGDGFVKTKVCTEAYGLRAFAPLMSSQIVAYARKLPSKLIRDKRVLKTELAKLVPRKLWDRPKHGFGIPLDRWLRAELRDIVEDALEKPLPVFNGEVVRRIVREFYRGNVGLKYKLWNLFVVHQWARSE